MLEERLYEFDEIAAYLHANTNRTIGNKLTRYKVEYQEEGVRGKPHTFSITKINDPFRVFCVFDLGLSPQTNFTKFRDFVFFLLTDDDFSWRPMELMEEYLRRFANGPSRQTISNYLTVLKDRELIALNGDYVYYRVYKDIDVQKHEIVTKEAYSQAWAVYWQERNEGADSRLAYCVMYSFFNGVPRKQHKIEQNVFYANTLDYLEELATNSFLAEYGEII